ncbi:anti-phage ZorAB system protein ZorA [Cellulomonas xiejunii]|uniref:anti-phage ZorAB system protein ZorA n=1 Tax=Cellulomonas xiejunii TaxID=2968083 RepID=UPI001D0DEFAB|nr:anti-phage ZorAB system protein ZorA [Cellulomonas xiejunii]MCC2314182.1 anti-phage defense ZorAB system protein ZorA [Cellulomonas xiejunii]
MNVFPDFGMLFSGTVEAVTPILVLVIWGLSLWVVLFATREARRAVALLKESARPLDGVVQGDLWARRSEIVERAEAQSDPVAHAWREFNETLVSDGRQLFNTVEAAEFFNEHRFAPRLVDNRLVHAAPTALTMLGLLGTFIGLTVGLRGLDLGSTADELRVGIQGLVHGASLGFTASLWGVFMSLVTNVSERYQERRVIKKARELQARIDDLFQMRSPEQSLSEIASSTAESKEALAHLHEKIGSSLQESVRTMTANTSEAVSAAIQESLAPIMQDLANRAANQSADVFKEISGQLTASFHDIGTTLATELRTSSESMRSTLEYMGTQLALQADQHLAHMAEMQRTTSAQIQAITEAASRQVELLDEALPKVVANLDRAAGLVGEAASGMETSTANLERVAGGLGEVSTTLGSTLAASVGTLDEMASRTVEVARALDGQREVVTNLAERSTAAADRLAEASRTLHGGFDAMRTTQGAFLEDLDKQLTRHSAAMAGWLADYGSKVEAQTAQRMDTWNSQTEAFTSNMIRATSALSDAVDELSVPRPVADASVGA